MKKCVGSFGSKDCRWTLCNDYNKCLLRYWSNKLDFPRGIPINKIMEEIRFRKKLIKQEKEAKND